MGFATTLILIVVLLAISFLVWFTYMLVHPRPGEPCFIYRFRRHPSAIPEYMAYLARGLFHPHLLRTGSSSDERKEPLPGDDLVPHPTWQETRATTIDVPVHHLWPWIVQLGDRRGGLLAFAYLSIFHRAELLTTRLGRAVLFMIGAVWLIRAAAEVIFFRLGADGAVWRLVILLVLSLTYLEQLVLIQTQTQEDE